jgi:four helix bundle protein
MKAPEKASCHKPDPTPSGSYKTFEDLLVYQAARGFRKAMYAVSRRLPNLERFELASQIRRAAVSLTNNIAEGHGRYHYLDQVKFCLQARGSLEELMDDLNVCEDEGYLPVAEVATLKEQAWRAHQLLNGFIRWLRERKQGSSLSLHESAPACGLTEDELDALLNVPEVGSTPPASTLQRFNPSTL